MFSKKKAHVQVQKDREREREIELNKVNKYCNIINFKKSIYSRVFLFECLRSEPLFCDLREKRKQNRVSYGENTYRLESDCLSSSEDDEDVERDFCSDVEATVLESERDLYITKKRMNG